MMPTIEVADRVVVLKDDFIDINYKVGDIVVFYHPSNFSNITLTDKFYNSLQVWNYLFELEYELIYIKRVIGLPGDVIKVDTAGNVYRNNELITIDGIDNETYSSNSTYNVPEDSYFLLGDNRSNSQDSRIFGFVPSANILGKAQYIVYPFDNFLKIND